MKRLWILALFAALTFSIFAACGDDDDTPSSTSTAAAPAVTAAPTEIGGTMILATTTSTQDSGLLDVLVPMFEDETGVTVQTVAVGSGQAIEQASRGDADAVFAHSPAAEKTMVADGNGVARILVMHNDFIIVGPQADPAALTGSADEKAALTAISTARSPFISRGDDSGTHALELKLWEGAAIDPAGQSWYAETGQGMGATLQVASQKQGYTITDRATFLAQAENLDLVLLFQGTPPLLNYYHVIVVNPEKHAGVKADAARAFAAFVVRPDVQKVIEEFGVADFGEPLFVPDAGKPDPTE